MRKFEDDVIISGLGQSEVGRRLDRSPLQLTVDAISTALADAGLTPSDVDGLASYPGGGTALGPGFAGPSLAEVSDAVGLEVDLMMGNFEGPAQLGPIVNAGLAISGGLARHVVVYRTVNEGSARTRARQAGRPTTPEAGPTPWITAFGGGPGIVGFALLARRHFHEYGTTREQLAQVALTARRHAAFNPAAVYREPLSLPEYLDARMIADPLCLYDCDVHCDGSTAVVLSARRSRAGRCRTRPCTSKRSGSPRPPGRITPSTPSSSPAGEPRRRCGTARRCSPATSRSPGSTTVSAS